MDLDNKKAESALGRLRRSRPQRLPLRRPRGQQESRCLPQYLRAEIRGQYFYLDLMMDAWSCKPVGFAVHDAECTGLALALLVSAVESERCNGEQLVLHADNGGPM